MTVNILIRYGELALKGKNRIQFEQRLQRNLKEALEGYDAEITRLHGRFYVKGPDRYLDQIADSLSKIFGVVSFSPVWETELDIELIKNKAEEITAELTPGPKSFKIAARRANKSFPYTSPELGRLLGSHLQQLDPELVVDLETPSYTLFVEIGYSKAFLYLHRFAGPGGLPVGSSGRSLLLLSGGIDSPVAGWLAMKRGLSIEALHFHSYPFTGKRSQQKTIDLCRRLTKYTNKIPLHLISVTAIQKELKKNCPEELNIILLRRMMIRLAEIMCRERHLKALVTGENLGQVASQTLESIHVIGRATEILILRPLLSMDKLEIIEMARKINTYETSILPYEDCCTLFVPKKPATKPKLETVERYEEKIDLQSLLENAIQSRETRIVNRV